MSRARPPWWMYVIAASFLAFLSLMAYVSFWGPELLGIELDYSQGVFRVREVLADSPAMRAGVRPGDIIAAMDEQVILGRYDWVAARQNFDIGRAHRLQLRRGSELLETSFTLGRSRSFQSAQDLINVATIGSFFLMLSLAFLIAYQRPRDSVARFAALYLAGMSIFGAFIIPPGFAAAWRQLPIVLGGLLWIARVIGPFQGPITLAFCLVFPQKFELPRWVRVAAWVPALAVAPFILYFQFRAVYLPGWVVSPWVARVLSMEGFLLIAYGCVALGIFVLNYRRLEDLNQKRRVRILLAGFLVGGLPGVPFIIAYAQGGTTPLTRFFLSSSYVLVASFLFVIFPISYAYVVLRHRMFDVRVMIRQGLQYALARRLVLSLVPALAVLFLLDLLLHGDQPLLSILKARGWIYISLGGLALSAHLNRQSWMEALDRRFFRERYDAQRLLREVAEEARRAGSFERVAPRAVAQIETAIHPEFVALMVREPNEPAFRTLSAAPAGQAPPPLGAESKLVMLLRVLGQPLEVPQTESGWLQQQLPHDETEFLRRARIHLLVPVATTAAGTGSQDAMRTQIALTPRIAAGGRTEVLLALGLKRSEEPYSREDQDLLGAVASSLALLLEKPEPASAPPRVSGVFEECPECGTCYDSGLDRCSNEGAHLMPTALPRLLVDRYRLERRLGRGGMGTVYEATDTALERRVAAKVIRDDLVGSADAAERFRREARASAAFAHPNVVTVHDFGVVAATRAFLVMELLTGASLREEIRREKRLPASRVVEILRGVCAAVEAAHRRQLIHRDLKPENIFLSRGEAGEVPKVLDFGVAKFLPTDTQVTVDADTGGYLVGTVRYMAPEQLRGEIVDPSWDLWALAVVAYEMLTGELPFEARTGGEFYRALQAGRFTPVSKHWPEAPARWEEFFTRVFSRAPDQRPHPASGFFAELERALG